VLQAETRSRCTQVSTGVTLRENNLKELEGARIMDSQGVLVGNRAALLARPELLAIVHELIERFEAHLTAGMRRASRV
jgi:ATP phosphoribosyltransferase